MNRYYWIPAAIIFFLGFTLTVFAIHEEVEIPPDLAGVGHYEKMPRATGGDVRHFITGHKPYRREFKLWPGQKEMKKGQEPHGALIVTYVNDIAFESIKKADGMANNSLIIKENHAPNTDLVSISVMYKVKGYNENGGDWFWALYDNEFNVLEEGKVKVCLDCHGTAKENDFIFTEKVK